LTLELQGAKLETDFTPNTIGWKILNASGSHKADDFDFGDGTVLKRSSLKHDDDVDEDAPADFD